jgi:phage-related holin
MKHTMTKLFTTLEALLGGAIGSVLWFVVPIAPFFWLAVGLVIADTITGIIAANKRGEKINSRGFARVLSKIIVYMVSILCCHGVEEVLKIDGYVTYVAVGAIASTELMSVLENTGKVTGANMVGVVGGLLSKFQKVPDKDQDKEE